MFNRKMKVEECSKCSCGLSKVQFYLKVRNFTKMKDLTKQETEELTSEIFEDPVIYEGTKLITREGNITDFLKIQGQCQIKDCAREHEARLEVRGGKVVGIQKGSIRALTESDEAKENWNL